MEDLPLEIIGEIAEKDGDTCWRLWFLLPRFSQIFEPRSYRDLFIKWGHDLKVVAMNLSYQREISTVFGHLHSVIDLPAVRTQCRIEWRYRGIIHRDGDLPAICTRFTMKWMRHGKPFRDGGLPTVVKHKRGWIMCYLPGGGRYGSHHDQPEVGEYREMFRAICASYFS